MQKTSIGMACLQPLGLPHANQKNRYVFGYARLGQV